LAVISSVSPPQSVANVIINDAVVDDRSTPVVKKTSLSSLGDLLRVIIGEALGIVLFSCDEMIDWEGVEGFSRLSEIIGDSVIDKVGKVQRAIV
jgi:hypothetical protein